MSGRIRSVRGAAETTSADGSGRAVHSAIDAAVLDCDEPGGKSLSRAHEHSLVEGVAVQIISSGHCEEGPAFGLGHRDVATRAEEPHADRDTDGDDHQSKEPDG